MFLQQLVNGITLGAVYALIALGYTMVYGILELINFAHGEIYMIGAYLGIVFLGIFTQWGLTSNSLLLSLAVVFVLSAVYCGAYGLTLEKIAYRPLRRAHRLAPLISARNSYALASWTYSGYRRVRRSATFSSLSS